MLAHYASPGMCVQREGRSVLGENVECWGCTGGDGESPLNHSYGETGGGVWGQPQGAVHTAAARLSCKRAVVGTE